MTTLLRVSKTLGLRIFCCIDDWPKLCNCLGINEYHQWMIQAGISMSDPSTPTVGPFLQKCPGHRIWVNQHCYLSIRIMGWISFVGLMLAMIMLLVYEYHYIPWYWRCGYNVEASWLSYYITKRMQSLWGWTYAYTVYSIVMCWRSCGEGTFYFLLMYVL